MTTSSWQSAEHTCPDRPLSPRETQYLKGVAQGQSFKEVARSHGVSPNTVHGAMARIYFKLGVHKSTAAVAKAVRTGIITPLLIVLTLSGLFSEEPFNRAPRTRPQAAQSRLLRPGRGQKGGNS